MNDDSIIYLITGLGLGVAVGMLFAPKAGSETRDSLRTQAQDGINYVKQRSEDISNAASDVVNKGTETVQQQTERIAKAVEAGKRAYSGGPELSDAPYA